MRYREMAKYVVVKAFSDIKDGCKVYMEGDIYPRDGLKPSFERISELSSNIVEKKDKSKDEVVSEKQAES